MTLLGDAMQRFLSIFIVVLVVSLLVPLVVHGKGVYYYGAVDSVSGGGGAGNDFSTDSNCVALYKIESGAITTDSKGANTLTNNNTVTANTVVFQEGAAAGEFVLANSEYLSCTDGNLDAGFPLKNGDTTKIISGACWLRLRNPVPTGNLVLVSKYDAGNDKRSFAVHVRNSGAAIWIRFWLGHTNGTAMETVAHDYTTMAAQTWYHLAWAVDGVNKTIVAQLRDVNGNTLGNDIDTTFTNALNVEDAAFCIGAITDATYFHDGQLDEVVIFKDLLTSSEMDQIRAGTYGN